VTVTVGIWILARFVRDLLEGKLSSPMELGLVLKWGTAQKNNLNGNEYENIFTKYFSDLLSIVSLGRAWGVSGHRGAKIIGPCAGGRGRKRFRKVKKEAIKKRAPSLKSPESNQVRLEGCEMERLLGGKRQGKIIGKGS